MGATSARFFCEQITSPVGLVVFLLCLVASTQPLKARSLTQKTEIRDYRVYGKTPGELVRYMKRRPFRGDNGPAMANIRPKYKLRTKTVALKKGTRGCRVQTINLDIRFVMTLPQSMQQKAQSRKTKKVWRSFRAFAQRHEERHRQIYMRCAKRFLAKARKMRHKSSCSRLKRQIDTLLKAEDKACNRQHDAFDRRDFPRVPNLALFREARQESHKARTRQNVSKRAKKSPAKGWFARRR